MKKIGISDTYISYPLSTDKYPSSIRYKLIFAIDLLFYTTYHFFSEFTQNKYIFNTKTRDNYNNIYTLLSLHISVYILQNSIVITVFVDKYCVFLFVVILNWMILFFSVDILGSLIRIHS